uniref:Uncharacterized protein n=1 Tax=Tetradesmus obliquus TaxID=3088 RepID=A0A383WND4_TETOB|eukprot:jgi/Sobl393_1/13683/SZX78679.1
MCTEPAAAAYNTITSIVRLLLGLPALATVLQAAIKGGYHQAIRALCAVPGARGLQPEQRAALLAVAKEAGVPDAALEPLAKPALVQLPVSPPLALGGSSSRQRVGGVPGQAPTAKCRPMSGAAAV